MSWTRQVAEEPPDSTPPRRFSESVGNHSTHPSPRSDVNIGASIRITGTLTGSEDLVIDGTVEGKIVLEQHALTIGQHGVIRAEVSAKTIHVEGEVTGNLTATEKIEVAASGSVHGDLHAPRVAIHDGARFQGSVDMAGRTAARDGKAEETSAMPEATRSAAAVG